MEDGCCDDIVTRAIRTRRDRTLGNSTSSLKV